ncbi:putative phage tail protein [Roseibium sp. TrichSKD4]|uniref:phage tail protein I n=1 Tax=Roseibium sp. TrichSKD4 TaxID=744980 RepID=UPI0001E575FC|nr:phage tail protein I [Roseibium sp. TrichSKD4]EFO30931.1 putative phage tail protein [Roseibium sp. TrichSKD4]
MVELSNHAGLLPPYADDHERRVASVGYSAQLDAAIATLATVTLPLNCPVEELPFLAWEESVDHWNDKWPIETKRLVVEFAEEIHIYKGTLQAVETAMASLSVRPEIVEWFEAEPPAPRGTFDVVAFVGSSRFEVFQVPDVAFKADVIAAINSSKPLSRHYAIRFGIEREVGSYLGAYVQTGSRYTAALPIDDPEPVPAVLLPAIASLYGGTFTASLEV